MATISITTSSAHDARILAAFGKYLNLNDEAGSPRAASGAEVKAYIVSHVKSIVQSMERTDPPVVDVS